MAELNITGGVEGCYGQRWQAGGLEEDHRFTDAVKERVTQVGVWEGVRRTGLDGGRRLAVATPEGSSGKERRKTGRKN